MTPFQLPDPNVQTTVVHPVTGETWEYIAGVWEVVPPDDDHTHTESEITDLHNIEGQMTALNTLVANMQQTIIDLNSKVQTLEGTQFITLE